MQLQPEWVSPECYGALAGFAVYPTFIQWQWKDRTGGSLQMQQISALGVIHQQGEGFGLATGLYVRDIGNGQYFFDMGETSSPHAMALIRSNQGVFQFR